MTIYLPNETDTFLKESRKPLEDNKKYGLEVEILNTWITAVKGSLTYDILLKGQIIKKVPRHLFKELKD